MNSPGLYLVAMRLTVVVYCIHSSRINFSTIVIHTIDTTLAVFCMATMVMLNLLLYYSCPTMDTIQDVCCVTTIVVENHFSLLEIM